MVLKVFACWLLACSVCIQDSAAVDSGLAQDEKLGEVAAVVGGYPITVARVDRHLKKTLGERSVSEPVRNRARAEALDYLIDRHVVLTSIRKSGGKIGESEINYELSHFQDRLREIGKTLEQHLEQSDTTQTELKYELGWRISWSKYLERQLTPEKLGKYYEKHRRKFDGTEMKVAHVLLDDKNVSPDKAIELATKIRSEIVDRQISWAEAVAKHSIATSSSSSEGEIGWVTYDGPMTADFCAAAMKLNQEEISPPISTSFGVHLIKCLEVKRGKVQREELQQHVKKDATQFLFDSLAKKNRAEIQIEYDAISSVESLSRQDGQSKAK